MSILSPYTRTPARAAVAWAVDPDHAVDDAGKLRRLDDVPEGVTVYTDYYRIEREWLRGHGDVILYAGKRTRYTNARGFTIRILPIQAPESDDAAAEGLFLWARTVQDHGARVGSLASTAGSLYRATCRDRILSGRAILPPFEPLGGRIGDTWTQGPHAGEFVQVDLTAAYATILGEIRYGWAWAEVDPRATLDPGTVAIARARVRVPAWCAVAGEPGRGRGPLPVRSRKHLSVWGQLLRHLREDVYPVPTERVGVWSVDELDAVAAMGARVDVERLWVNVAPRDRQPFAPWWEAIQELRRLPGYAGELGKGTGNAFVGSLIIRRETGLRVWWTKRGKRTAIVPVIPGGQPRYPALFETVTARCRARLLTDVLSRCGRPLSWHTDGAWITRDDLPNVGEGWRVKATATGVDYFDPMTYAFSDGVTTTYVVSGEDRRTAPVTFDELWISRMRDPARGKRVTPRLEPAA